MRPLLILCLAGLGTARAEWHGFTGKGNFQPAPSNRSLVDKASEVRLLWNGPEHLGICKGTSGGPVGDANKGSVATGVPMESLFYGGANSPIVAEGMVFVSYWVPSGPQDTQHPQKWTSDPEYPPLFKKISADDALIAIDAKTGKEVWKSIEVDGGVNVGGGKRTHWCVSPVYGEGRVFTMNPLGRIYGYDAKTGEKLWETPGDGYLRGLKATALKERHFARTGSPKTWNLIRQNSLAFADGVLLVPEPRGMRGIDPKTGAELWTSTHDPKSGTGINLHRRTTPGIWRHKGREYLVVNGSTELQLVDPRTGEVLWRRQTFPWIESPVVAGDLVICPLRPSEKLKFLVKEHPKYAVLGALRLSLKGAKVAWEFPDAPKTVRRLLISDSGSRRRIALGEGVAAVTFSKIKDKKIDPAERKAFGADLDGQMTRPARTFLVRLNDGKILTTIDEGHHEGEIIGYFLDRTHYLAHSDMQHSNRGIEYRLYGIDPDAGTSRHLGNMEKRHWQRTAYEVPIEMPVVDGRIYYRSLKGIACYDFGNP